MIHGKKTNLLTLYFSMIPLSAMLILFAHGCASVPMENAALKNARAVYEKAKTDPQVEANAAVPLYDAGRTLKRAEMATTDAETSHLAYLAEKQTAIAVTIAEQKLAEAEREKLAKDKDLILLEQRERQAREARGEAKTMALEADKQRMAAEQRAREAEEAQKLAEARRLEAETALAQAKALEQELADLKAKKTDRGFVLTLGDVLFATGKADLMPGAQRTIDQLAAFLHKYPAKKVSIEGHTDSVGSEDYNQVLSQRRAESVQSAIMARGISSDRISAKGLGELYPVASNDNPAGRQQNRRVEILILSDDETPAQNRE
jgi:outer membrane protein OmpA-like peptidoglycan-associated protein